MLPGLHANVGQVSTMAANTNQRAPAAMTASQLREFLRSRGITVQGYNKEMLVKMTNLAKASGIAEERDEYDHEEELARRRFVSLSIIVSMFVNRNTWLEIDICKQKHVDCSAFLLPSSS